MIEGRVIRGLGEGAYYVKLYSEEIKKILGKDPYPGTINLKVSKEEYLEVRRRARNRIRGKRKGSLVLHDAYYVKCLVKGEEGIVVFPTKGGHPGVLEVILPKKLEVKEGDLLRIYVTDVITPFPSPSNI